MPPEERPIGVVFQDLLLFPHLSAADNVAFPLRARGVAKARGARARGEVARATGRCRPRRGPPGRSLGRRGTAGGARTRSRRGAGAAAPDEPLSALDVGARVRVRELVREELARFPGVRIIVTHDPIEATTLADRLVLFEDGAVTQIGSPEEIRSSAEIALCGGPGRASTRSAVDSSRSRTAPGGSRQVRATSSFRWPEDFEGGEVIGLLRPVDVTLSLEPPAGSARNAFRGQVTSIAVEGDRARVRIATSPPLVAEVTARVRRAPRPECRRACVGVVQGGGGPGTPG